MPFSGGTWASRQSRRMLTETPARPQGRPVRVTKMGPEEIPCLRRELLDYARRQSGRRWGIASPGRSRTPSPAASTVTCSSSWTGNPVEVNSLISR